VNITSVPAAAAVFVDGVEVGQTPLRNHELTPGSHSVEVQRTGYESDTRQVTVNAGRTSNLDFPLTRTGSAQLAIQSTLLGASLRVSGDAVQSAALNNPQETVNLPPGHYLLQVRAPGYAAWSREIDLADGDNSTVPVTLVPRSKATAGLLAILPGVGHFYANRPGKGVLMMAATLGSIIYGAGQFSSYATDRNEYNQLVASYNTASTYQELNTIKAEMEAKHLEVRESHNKLGSVLTVIGGVWLFNIIDASLLMPRLRNVSGGSPVPDLDLGTRRGRLTLSLRVSF